MEMYDVSTSKKMLQLNEHFSIQFRISGALPVGFTFPFSNESLDERLLELIERKKV